MKEYTFDAVIKASEIGKGGAYIEFPYNVMEEFGEKGRIKVMSFFDGIEYRGSLVKKGDLKHIIGVSKEIRNRIGKDHGDTVTIKLHKDECQKPIVIHPLLKKEFDADSTLEAKYEKLCYTRKKEIFTQLAGAKKEETVRSRLEKIILELNKDNDPNEC